MQVLTIQKRNYFIYISILIYKGGQYMVAGMHFYEDILKSTKLYTIQCKIK